MTAEISPTTNTVVETSGGIQVPAPVASDSLAHVFGRQRTWTDHHLHAAALAVDLALTVAIGSRFGFGTVMHLAMHQPAVHDFLAESIKAVLPDGAVEDLGANDEVPKGKPGGPTCLLLRGTPANAETERRLKEFAALGRSVISLSLSDDDHAFALAHTLSVRESLGEQAVEAGMWLAESEYTVAGRKAMSEWSEICQGLRLALTQTGAVVVTLPSVAGGLLPVVSPQASVRLRQIMGLAATLVAVRGEAIGTENDVANAVQLLRSAGAADDWPGTPEHIVRLGELLAGLCWGSDGWTYEKVLEAMNRECLSQLSDKRYWPPSGAPTARWTYPTVRRRMEAMERLGWLRRERRGQTFVWFRTPDIKELGAAKSFFDRVDEVFQANGGSFSAQAENTATGVGR